MSDSKFVIDILDMYWISKEKDNPEDLCLNGNVSVKIGEATVAYNYPCTVSSTALYLLKSIKLDHIMGESANQMLPCCGFFIIPNDIDDTVEISGCLNGIDWSIFHIDGYVTIITEKGSKVNIESNIYRKIVFDFADKMKGFYKNSQEKDLPTDDFDRKGYINFWKGWKNRRYLAID
jgi:hypothetical protein